MHDRLFPTRIYQRNASLHFSRPAFGHKRKGDSAVADIARVSAEVTLPKTALPSLPTDDAPRWGYSRARTQFQPQLRLARSLGVRHTAISFFSLHMIETSLGQRLRELRDRADLSLRELAKRSGISSPFLSDIELGRRFPSEEILGKLAAALNVPVEDLKKYDNRGPIADLKRLMDSDPKLGFAFRTAVEKVKSGELTARRPADYKFTASAMFRIA
jgi:transcriptional regulator with XRE-family HTH domain